MRDGLVIIRPVCEILYPPSMKYETHKQNDAQNLLQYFEIEFCS